MCGDFNCPVQAMAESGFSASNQGRVVSSSGGTCRSAIGNWSCIDYFILSRHLLPAVIATQLVRSEYPRPHLPIRLRLSEKPRQYREPVLKKYVAFPKTTPFGPHPRPPNWSYDDITVGLTGQERINAMHAFMMDGIEEELANAYDIPQDCRDPFLGRGRTPKFVWRHAGGAPSWHYPASNRTGGRWRLAQRRAEDLYGECNRGKTPKLYQCMNLLEHDLNDLSSGSGEFTYYWRIRVACNLLEEVGKQAWAFAEKSMRKADNLGQEEANNRMSGFRQWAKKAVAAGGGAAHAFAKVPRACRATLVPGGPHPGGAGEPVFEAA